ncbi:hypothetical protein GE115_09825 [Agromyces sp. CFH 90414]|uniref:Uncharacterized protein n=1 Tax=Agromyces agglutinans TaxID=2662258 RepID=A0A6I2FE43_9MICO|nr:DUF6412 domain-containing protein [Agromyces agglutinans]MRG60163.1 hypothetical protein [Agromyces agglutinans]
MIETFVALWRSHQAVLEIALASDSGLTAMLVGVVGAAALAVVIITSRAVPALVAADPAGASQRLRQTADPWRLLSQSDPDAPGRARPRAPGRGIPAA